jgi:hypothetical protein
VAETVSLYTSGVYGHIWFSCTSINSVFMSHSCYSALSIADGSPFLCALLQFQALLLFWALWFLFIIINFFSSFFLSFFRFFHCELHITVCHILRVVDPHHVALCKELVSHCTGMSHFMLGTRF